MTHPTELPDAPPCCADEAGADSGKQREAGVTNRLFADQRRMDQFLATLSHELRNPLASLQYALDVWRVSPPGAVQGEELRLVMERQVRHLARLVDDLLDVSRIARGRFELRCEPIELAEVVQKAVEASRPVIEAGGHQLEVTQPATPLRLEADPARLVEVLANLLNNAAKYTPPHGHIWLAVERVEAAPTATDAPTAPGLAHAVIRVRDSGVGIARELLPRVFDVFWQADSSLNRAQGGLGIGLTLAKNLIEMHAGTIEAKSEGPARGSEFVIRLPLAEESRRPAGGPVSPAAPAALPQRRILVVDDIRTNAYMLGKLLEAIGQQVRIAHDAPTALAIARAERPDVVISDIAMPGMTGYELAERLRTEPGMAGVVLVALTGHAQAADKERAAAAGFRRHLTKPVSLADLENLLRSAG